MPGLLSQPRQSLFGTSTPATRMLRDVTTWKPPAQPPTEEAIRKLLFPHLEAQQSPIARMFPPPWATVSERPADTVARRYGIGKRTDNARNPANGAPTQVRAGHCRPEDVHLTGVAPGVDWDFVIGREGCRTAAYVPPGGPRSGITIGRGFDIGQRNADDLQTLGLPQDIVTTLTPYLGRSGQDAARYREEHPLQMTQAQVDLIDRQAMNQAHDHVATAFNRASRNGRRFQDLPTEAQTAIMDLAHQYGPDLANAAPNAWRFATNGQWDELHNELMHFGDQYGPRREAEARLLRRAIDNGTLSDAPPRNGARPTEERPTRR